MKIEIGESLFYSWLRHAKECPIVQSNWKPSPTWELQDTENIEKMMVYSDEHFRNKYNYEVFKNNTLSQLLQQAEIDVMGISLSDNAIMLYAVDVAYHESGLNYGDRRETTIRVIKKVLRTAMCIRSYFGTVKAEIVFASPKINPANLADIVPTFTDMNEVFTDIGWDYTARIIANEDFNELVLKPIIVASNNVSDTSELFLRAFQLVKMFSAEPRAHRTSSVKRTPSLSSDGALGELKIGRVAQTTLRGILESGVISDAEVEQMQTKEYSKQVFGIDFPLLTGTDKERSRVRYYANPLRINDKDYYLCSQWYEIETNNDRPFLMKWLEEKGALLNEGSGE